MIRRAVKKGRGICPGLFFLLLSACAAPPGQSVFTGRTMGTTYTVKAAGAKLGAAQQAALHAAVEARLTEINALMSTYDPESELSRFNDFKSTAPFPVSAETGFVAKAALEFARKTGGAFDPTVGPLVDLWGFGPAAAPDGVPTNAQIASVRNFIGYQKLSVSESPWSLQKSVSGLRVDLSAIAKGYGVDSVAALLIEHGVDNFMVEIGGEVFARGRGPRGGRWTLGIETPVENGPPGSQLSASIPVDGKGLASSGGYRNFYLRGGKKYSHFIDPRSAVPVPLGLASASVLAPSCMEADAAATAVMVLGEEAGLAFLDADPEMQGLLLISDEAGGFRTVKTSGWPQ